MSNPFKSKDDKQLSIILKQCIENNIHTIPKTGDTYFFTEYEGKKYCITEKSYYLIQEFKNQ